MNLRPMLITGDNTRASHGAAIALLEVGGASNPTEEVAESSR
jgi:hypothetical protein